MDKDRVVYLMAAMYKAGQDNILGKSVDFAAGDAEANALRKEALVLADSLDEKYTLSIWYALLKDEKHYKSDEVYGALFGSNAPRTSEAYAARGTVNHFLRAIEVAHQFRELLTKTAEMHYQRWKEAVDEASQYLGEIDAVVENVDPALKSKRLSLD